MFHLRHEFGEIGRRRALLHAVPWCRIAIVMFCERPLCDRLAHRYAADIDRCHTINLKLLVRLLRAML
jgi:hypothetical protein